MGGWQWKRLNCKGFGRSILGIFIIQIRRNRLQSTCAAHLARRIEVEARVGKLKNGKAAGNDEVTGEMLCRKNGDLLRSFHCTKVKDGI